MSGRPRCAHCGKAFTPHPRNRNRREQRQRVCGACGQAVGHRLAAQRCRARKRTSRHLNTPAGPISRPTTAPAVGLLAGELALQIQRICTALIAVVHGSGRPSTAA